MASFLPQIEIVLPFPQGGATDSKKSASPPKEKAPAKKSKQWSFLQKTTTEVCKNTGKIMRRTTMVWPIKVLLSLLDLIGAPFGHMAGKDINFPLLWKVGCGFILVSFWLYILLDTNASRIFTEIGMGATPAGQVALVLKTIFPGFIAVAGMCMIVGGIRLQQGKSFLAKFGAELEPLPAFESGFALKIGDVKLSLRDAHTGIGAFGGIGSGKTVSMMVPLMRQFFRQLRDPDDESEYANCGALILDEKGDFIDSTITEMILAGRSLQDLVLIDPDLDLYRYNPLDPNQTADENAAKLAKVQKILGSGSGGDNAYWDQTSQATIKGFLQLLEVYKPKHKIGMDDIARFMRDDDLATILCDTVEKTLEEKKKNNEISEEDYGAYSDAVSSVRNAWINLNPNTKSTLKTTITNMLGPIAQNPRLQKVFCRDTNFSFRDLPNKGKIVLFRGSGIDKSTARLICVCLKIDFQTWQKRRNGSAAAAYGLNTMRTVLFICDEYQEFVTCGGEGDETFYGVSRSTRTAPIVATQSYNSLETAIKNKEQTKTLRQNIATWVFFRTTDQDTCELGKFLAGQSKREDFSTSQDTTGLMETASNLAGSGGGKGSSISISKKLEDNFRTDDFSRLVTMTMEKSRKGPWYSEAIVYNYHDIDESAESRCYKTRLPHLYYDNKLRKQASLNVRHLDQVLIDRNWQRKVLHRGLLLVQRSMVEAENLKRTDMMRISSAKEIEESKKKTAASPEMAQQLKRVEGILENSQKSLAADKAALSPGSSGIPGALDTNDENDSRETAATTLKALEDKLANTSDDSEIALIEIEIDEERKRLARLTIVEGGKTNVPSKEVLRANESLPGLANENIEEEIEEGNTAANLLGEAVNTGDEEEDALWDVPVPDDAVPPELEETPQNRPINLASLSPLPEEEDPQIPMPDVQIEGEPTQTEPDEPLDPTPKEPDEIPVQEPEETPEETPGINSSVLDPDWENLDDDENTDPEEK